MSNYIYIYVCQLHNIFINLILKNGKEGDA